MPENNAPLLAYIDEVISRSEESMLGIGAIGLMSRIGLMADAARNARLLAERAGADHPHREPFDMLDELKKAMAARAGQAPQDGRPLDDAIAKVVEGFAKGIFVRAIDADSKPDWAVKLLPYLVALATLEQSGGRAAARGAGADA